MRARDLFTTIRTEGGLLPADLLQRIAGGDSDLEGLKPSDYHLAGTERLNEAISRAWNRLLGAWTSFRAAAEKLPESDLGTSPTRERWLLILFQELGYGRLPAARGVEIEGKAYPVSHFWQNTPIHLVGFRVDLDRRARGVAGAARTSPHSLVQEFLNRSEGHLWGFVSNGLRLRILRDNVSLTRQSYVEFDLEGMMDGEVYADFALLWLLCHESRVEGDKPEQCWLERWVRVAQEQGTRALEHLRDGVTKAIKSLGRGFLAHPRNTVLRDKLRSGELAKLDYFRQLLRLVYRMIFLFAAEDRGLLLDPNAEPIARERYTRFYSTSRLRRLAEKRRGTKHADLYQGLRVVMERLGSDTGCPELALPALGSFLWQEAAVPDLAHADIANHDLLDAVRALAFTVEEKVFRVIDYKNMGAEELGSVYESLLEMHPEINAEAAAFDLKVAPGHERKTTGSYYTPASLVNCLLDSALDPVVDARLKEASRMANSEWQVVSSQLTAEEKRHVYRVLSGSGGVAAGTSSRQGGLRPDGELSGGRTLRPREPDSARGNLHTGEHSRGMGQALPGGVHPVSASGQRQPDGTGNASHHLDGSGLRQATSGGKPPEGDRGSRQTTPDVGAHPPEAPEGLTPLAAHRSPIAMDRLWRKSPLAIRYSLFAEQALLRLRVCDPACGSGHFLVTAAHRMAKRLAAIRTGDEEPAPEAYRTALRDVIGHCIYGVDINPMAVELCKVSLWMEALEPGKPLSFLDHHIQCGNSLLGATPALLKKGIPDEAFKPITGDDREYCREVKRLNRRERRDFERGQRTLFYPWERLGDLPSAIIGIDGIDDATIDGVRAKQERYEQLVKSTGYEFGRLWADAWCAAFVWIKRPPDAANSEQRMANGKEPNFSDRSPVTTRHSLPYAITEEIFRAIEKSPHSVPQWMKDEIQRLARQYQFFHWHLAFPDVFRPAPVQRTANGDDHSPLATHHSPPSGHSPLAANPQGWLGGFDVVLGNPPWERIKLQEKEFFAARAPDIANAKPASKRRALIRQLRTKDPDLYRTYQEALRISEGESHLVRNSRRYPFCGTGDVNTYALFAETKRLILSGSGRIGCIVPSGIATDNTTRHFFQDVVNRRLLVSLLDFENQERLFPAVAPPQRFCLLTLSGANAPIHSGANFVFFATNESHIHDKDRHFKLTAEEIALLNPNTRTCPIFRSKRDAELTKAIYRRVPVLIKEADDGQSEENPWRISFLRMFDMTNDSHLFRTRERLEGEDYQVQGNVFLKSSERWLPLFEAKLFHQYEHRYNCFSEVPEKARYGVKAFALELPEEKRRDPDKYNLPRYWVPSTEVLARIATNRGYLLAFRGIINVSTNRRTFVTTILPFVGLGNSSPVMLFEGELFISGLLANLNSYPLDYSLRQCIGGSNLNFFIVKQVPVLLPRVYAKCCVWNPNKDIGDKWIVPRVVELTYTAWDLEPFACDCGYDGPPFIWDEERRFLIRCELDAAFFHLYLPAAANGEWRVASREEGAVVDETPEQLAELKKYFPTPRDAVAYIMDTFPIVKRKDEQKYGEYRTKRVILEIYDEMQAAIAAASREQRVASGEPATADAVRHSPFTTRRRYQTRLDPPPGPPCDAQGNFIPMAQWDPANWPSHIHRPKEAVVEVPEEVPVAEFASMAYPATDADKAICAAALAVVEHSGGISSMEHLDALLLATHPDWCKAFLDQADQRALDTAIRSAPSELFVGQNQSIRWKDCRDYLEQLNAVAVTHGSKVQPIGAGTALPSVKSGLPTGVDGVVKYALKALKRIRELRKDLSSVPQVQRIILDALEEQHRLYDLVA